jgi:GNAT superfamily N-acetyltransferase
MTYVFSISDVNMRSVRRDDLIAAADLLMLTSATGVRHQVEQQLALAESGERGCAFVAERDGAVIGSALLTSEPTFPGSVITLVSVIESARGAGVGTALADLLDERLAQETLPASCRMRDDLTDGRRFAERRGYTLTSHSVGWSADLTADDGTLERLAWQAAEAAGVRIRQVDMSSEAGTVLECAGRCMPGLPAEQQGSAEEGAGLIPDDAVVLLAEADGSGKHGARGVALGLTIVAPQNEGDTWYTLFTGVDADHRRAGVARALKSESFARGRSLGARSLLTHNHDTNKPIVGLNSAFGMRPALGYWSFLRHPQSAAARKA